jgi:MSHA biogenesis protein MshQ
MIQSIFRTWAKWLLAGCLCLLPTTGAWAAVTYVSSSVGSLSNSSVSSVQINNPTGLVVGDLMVAFLAQNSPGSPIVSSATGWTSVLNRTYTDGSTVGTSVYYRFATAADISNGSFTFSFTSSRRSAGAILAFRGVDTVTPINASGSQGNNASTSLTAPSITTVDNNAMLVSLYGFVQGSNSATPSAGMTEAFDAATGAGPNGVTIEGAYAIQATVGPTGTRVATAATTSVNIGVLLALSPAATTLAEYRFDEFAWGGTAGEVLDSSGNGYNATAYAGATTDVGSPAYASGSQNTCRYGYFDHVGVTRTYVQLPASLPKMDGSYSVAAWIRSPSPSLQQQRIFSSDDNDDGWGLSLADTTTGGIRLFNRNVNFTSTSGAGAGSGGVILQTPNNVIAANTWYYVAATVNAVTKQARIYVYDTAGSQRALTTGTYTGTWCASGTCTGATAIGGETSASSEGQQAGFHFLGHIDEPRFYQGALTQAMIQSLLTTVRTCPLGAPDHLQIEYPGDGLTCTPSTVTVKACANATCSLLYTGGGVSGTLSPGGASFAIGITGVTSSTVSSSTSPATLSATYTPATPNGLTCLNTVSNSTSCGMNFSSAGFLFSAAADGIEATIPTQVAGTSSSTYYLRAVRTGTTTRACEAALTGAQSVNLGYQCNNPTTCSGSNLMSVNGGTPTVIARNDNGVSGSSTGVNLTFDANGNAPLTWTYGDVGQVTLLANKTVGGVPLTGATNPFVVKPGGFVVSDIKQTASPQLANPVTGGAAGARFVMAGESFTATVTATTSGGVVTPNYGRETQPEGVSLTPALVLPAGGSNATLTNGVIGGSSFTSGVATVNNLSWGEVGIMTLTPRVGDGDYLGAGDVAGTTTSNVGRFYPAQFSISAASLAPACVPGAPATSFTYFGEDGFTTAFTLTAQNLTGGTTSNYRDAFAKLDLALYGSYGFSAAALPTGSSLSSSTSAPSGSWANGVTTVTAKHQISRPTDLTAPTSVALTAAPTDGEVPAASPAMALGSTTLRYGRLQLFNAYGSELLDLPLTLRAQYWNGSAWVTNSDDSCTTITAPTSGSGLTFYPEVAAGAPGNHLSAAETTATVNVTGKLASGDAGLRFSRPGAGNSGYVDISIPLAVRPWLQFPWGISAVNPTGLNPTGRATFGIYRSRLIYSRENY